MKKRKYTLWSGHAYLLCFILLIYALPCFSATSDVTEKMYLNIEWKGIKVADTEFVHYIKDGRHHISARTKSSFLAGIAYSFDNVYQIVADVQLRPLTYIKDIKQKNFTESSRTMYDYTGLTATYSESVTDTMFSYAITPDTRDFFSALFYLRASDLRQNISFTVDNAWRLSTISTRYIASESLRTRIGNIQTNKIQVSFQEINRAQSRRSDILTNNLVRDENRLYIWFTDDGRNIPVKAQFTGRQNVNWTITRYEQS